MPQALTIAADNKTLIDEILSRICLHRISADNHADDCGLLHGLSGDLLFLHRYGQYQQNAFEPSIFANKLDFLMSQLPCGGQTSEIPSNLSGQGWFLEYLKQHTATDFDPKLADEIDRLLQQSFDQTCHSEIDPTLCMSGIGVYAARRNKQQKGADLFELLLAHYDQIAIMLGESLLSWSEPNATPERQNNEIEREFNLGMAHGIPSIMAALLPMLDIPKLQHHAEQLLRQCGAWLLSQQHHGAHHSNYAADVYGDGNKDSYFGWCYGDLTIALTLARAGKALNLPHYLENAIEISVKAANRGSIEGDVKDASLCHGSAGMALLFLELNNRLDQPQLLKAANGWLQFTLNLYQQKELEGFHLYNANTEQYQENSGLLMGHCGIGLCLLAALGEPTDWIDCLLMA